MKWLGIKLENPLFWGGLLFSGPDIKYVTSREAVHSTLLMVLCNFM
jgi:hypothetical protein